MQKFVALFDIHIGYEYVNKNGTLQVVPVHNTELLNKVMRFCKDYDPNIVVLGGDQLNCGPITHWNKGKPKLNENFRLKKEMDLLNDLILNPIDSLPNISKKVWMYGNHEVWVSDLINSNPGVEGLIEPEQYLKLKERNYEIKSQGELTKLGKLYICHGDTVFKSFSSEHPSKKLVSVYRRSIRCGHLHTYDVSTDVSAVDTKDCHTGIVVPCLCSTNVSYMKNAPSRAINGFLVGEIYDNGDFQDHVIIITKNKFRWNGIQY